MKGGASAILEHEMRIRNLIKELEEAIERSRGFLYWRFVNEQNVSVILRRIESALPNELRMAEEIVREREKCLRAAHEEAERILREAEKERERMLEQAQQEVERRTNQSEITRLAEQKAEELLRRAEQRADETLSRAVEESRRILSDATESALRILDKLESVLEKLIEATRICREDIKGEAKSFSYEAQPEEASETGER